MHVSCRLYEVANSVARVACRGLNKGRLHSVLRAWVAGRNRSPVGQLGGRGLYDIASSANIVVLSILGHDIKPQPHCQIFGLCLRNIGMEHQTATRYQPISGDLECDIGEEKDNRAKQGFLASKITDRRTCLLFVVLFVSLLTNIVFMAQRSRFTSKKCDNLSTYGIVLYRECDTYFTDIPQQTSMAIYTPRNCCRSQSTSTKSN
jgi:hypothetical protein